MSGRSTGGSSPRMTESPQSSGWPRVLFSCTRRETSGLTRALINIHRERGAGFHRLIQHAKRVVVKISRNKRRVT